MFKNRSLNIQMVKNPKRNDSTETTEECNHFDLEMLNGIVKDQVKHSAIAIVSGIAVTIAMKTVSEIIVNAAKS